MIIGIGTDILQLSRLHAWPLRRLQRLSARILTNKERELLGDIATVQSSGLFGRNRSQNVNDPQFQAEMKTIVRFLGVRWAAKEALYKAIYPYQTLCWKDVELLPIREDSLHGIQDIDSNMSRLSAKLQAVFTSPLCLTIDESAVAYPKTHVSVSHDGGLIVAMAVVEGYACSLGGVE